MPKYYIYNPSQSEDALYHYGVKGMKWGVRRDVKLLANRRFNVKRKRLKRDYKLGKFSKEERKEKLRGLKADRKKFLSDVKQDYEKLKTSNERYRFNKNIVNMTTKEVPHVKLKRGLSVANVALTGVLGGAAVISGVGIAGSTALAGAGIKTVALGATVTGFSGATLVGDHYIRNTILNRTT